MALRSNTDLLTGSAVHRRKPREKSNVTIVFDEKSRVEYLTGFQKRNKEKKQEKAARYKEQLRRDKAEKRREKRKRIREAISEFVKSDPSFEEYRKDLEVAEEDKIISEIKYEDEDASTTVIIEEMEQ